MIDSVVRTPWLERILPLTASESDPVLRFRAKLVLGFGLFGFLVTGLTSVTEIIWGTSPLGLVLGISTLVMGMSFHQLRRGYVDRSALLLTTVILLSVTVANFGSGGRALGANMALPTVIMFSILVLSTRSAVIVTVLMLVEILIVAMLRRMDLDFPLLPDPEWVQSAIDRIPLFMSLGAAAIGFLTRHALTRYRQELLNAQADFAELHGQNSLILDVAGDGIYFIDHAGAIVFANPAAAQMLGYSVDELQGKLAHDTIHHSLADGTAYPITQCPIYATVSDGITRTVEDDLFWHKSGRSVVVRFSVAVTRDKRGEVTGTVVVFQDITEAKRHAAVLAANEKRLSDLFEFSLGLMCTHALDGTILSLNPAASGTLGYDAADLIGRNLGELVPMERKPYFDEYLDQIGSEGMCSGRFQLTTKTGGQCIWEFNNVVCEGLDGLPYVLGNAVDVTERRVLESRLREQSIRDPLTGCFNRRYLDQREAGFTEGTIWGCIVVDLDHFKQINDSQGHQRGDEILNAVGRFLSLHVRDGDDVIRMGGDEFLLLLPGADAPTTQAIAARIGEEAVAAVACGLSIGSAARDGDESLENTIDRADKQLYKRRFVARGVERRAAPPT